MDKLKGILITRRDKLVVIVIMLLLVTMATLSMTTMSKERLNVNAASGNTRAQAIYGLNGMSVSLQLVFGNAAGNASSTLNSGGNVYDVGSSVYIRSNHTETLGGAFFSNWWCNLQVVLQVNGTNVIDTMFSDSGNTGFLGTPTANVTGNSATYNGIKASDTYDNGQYVGGTNYMVYFWINYGGSWGTNDTRTGNFYFNIDNDVPTIEFDIPANNVVDGVNYYNNDFEVRARDDYSGVDRIEYSDYVSTSGGSVTWGSWTNSGAVGSLKQSGSIYRRYRALDNVGRISSILTAVNSKVMEFGNERELERGMYGHRGTMLIYPQHLSQIRLNGDIALRLGMRL